MYSRSSACLLQLVRRVVRHAFRISGIVLLFHAFLLLVCPTACADDQSLLDIRWQFARKIAPHDPGSMHIGIRNAGNTTVTVDTVKVGAKNVITTSNAFVPTDEEYRKRVFPESMTPGDVMWCWVTDRELAPNAMTEIIIKWNVKPADGEQITIATREGHSIQCSVETEPSTVEITAVTFSKERDVVYAYVRNAGREALDFSEVELVRSAKTVRGEWLVSSTRERQTNCGVIKLDTPLELGESVYIRARPAGKAAVGTWSRCFSSFPLVRFWNGTVSFPDTSNWDGLDGWISFAEDPYLQLDMVGPQILSNRESVRSDKPLYYWSSQGFLKYGTMAFGELVDCASVHIQPVDAEYLGSFSTTDQHCVQAKSRYLRRALSPKPVYGHVEVGHAVMSNGYQGILQPEEMRLRLYYMISRGVKGLLFRCGGRELLNLSTETERRALKRELKTIESEINRLRPLLRIGEFVERISECTEPLVEPATLLCGDRGMAIILLNHDRQQSWPENEMHLGRQFWIEPKLDPFDVKINIPSGRSVVSIKEVGGKEASPRYTVADGVLVFQVDGLLTTRQFVIAFENDVLPDADLRSNTAVNWKSNVKDSFIDDIDSLIQQQEDKLFSSTRAGEVKAQRGHWFTGSRVTSLNHLPPKAVGPDAQCDYKQYYFKQVVPNDQTVSHDFVVRNVGTAPLLLRPEYEDSWTGNPSIQVDNSPVAAGKACIVRMSIARTVGRRHAVAFLATNDPNEPVLRLEMGGDVRPEFTVEPETIQFDADYPSGLRKRYTVIVKGEQSLKLHSLTPDVPYVKVNLLRKETARDGALKDIFLEESVECTYQATIDVDASNLEFNKKYTPHIYFKTNSKWKPNIDVPLEINVRLPVRASPPRLGFGVVRKLEKRVVSIRSRVKEWEVVGISCDHPAFAVSNAGKKEGQEVTIVVSVDPKNSQGLLKTNITVSLDIDGKRASLSIPCVAMSISAKKIGSDQK